MKDEAGRVTGIGGVFFRTSDVEKTKAWYRDNLGLATDEYGTNFEWRQADAGTEKGFTQWSPFTSDSEYFAPSDKDFMLNYRVINLEALLARLRANGVTVASEIKHYDYGKFAQIMDLDGNKVELWEPNDAEYEKILDGRTK